MMTRYLVAFKNNWNTETKNKEDKIDSTKGIFKKKLIKKLFLNGNAHKIISNHKKGSKG